MQFDEGVLEELVGQAVVLKNCKCINGEKVSVRVNDEMFEKISESKVLDATTL